MNADRLKQIREEKNTFFKLHPQSPLNPEQRESFKGLNYYEPNPDLELRVTVEPFEQQDVVRIQTTTGQLQPYRRYGRFKFNVGDEEAELTLYFGMNGFFLPFVDANANKETYGAGRYLEPELLPGEEAFLIDFNQAYNPYCAYNESWSCPITPAENRIDVPVQAGEKLFEA